MPEEDEMMGGGGGGTMPEDEGGGTGESGGGGGLPDTDTNQDCQFIDGQWVCTTPEQPEPETPSQTQCPSCNQIAPTPPSGTRGNYFWDSKEIIEKATKPLNKKKKQ